MNTKILATGSYVPEREVPNTGLTQFPPSTAALIEEKTGIKARRYAGEHESTSDLAARAAQACLDQAGVSASAVEGIILATSSPDRMQPATATRVQALLGADNAFAFDVNSVCSGAVYALELGKALIQSGSASSLLVIASEVYSRILNPADFATTPYFGDGAGAVLLQKSIGQADILQTVLRSDGKGSDVIQVPCGGTMLPYSNMRSPREQYFTMRGKEVYTFAVEKGSEIIAEILEKAGLHQDEVACVISHQANINIINEIARRTSIPRERFYTNLEKYGNTAAASVFIALDEWVRGEGVKRGQIVLLVAFGGGLSWAAALVRF